MDGDDGSRLAAGHPTESRAMASTTKLMTAYLALHQLPLDKRLVAPPYHPVLGESLLGLEPGERISVHDLLYGLLLPSGNDAALTLADGVAGSPGAFVGEMNAAARRIGLHDTSYANPIGLDDPSNYSSPRDLAKLALRLRRDRLFRRIVDTPQTTLQTGAHPRTIVNRNALILRVPWINGVKTGYTPDAGNVLVGSGTRKGITLVSVVMGEPSEATRDDDTIALLRYGFSLYRHRTPVERGQKVTTAPVPNADAELPLLAGRSLQVTVRRDERTDVSVQVPDTVDAPVTRGQRIGTATVSVEGTAAGSVPLLAGRTLTVASSGSLVERADDALPGPRAVVWGIAGGATAAIVIGIAVALTRGRRD
jgi:D-alanyl-D-alanine carboxypeptidase (penicillin-binding protein 5/6)